MVFINLSINYLQLPSCILVGSLFGLTAACLLVGLIASLYIKHYKPHKWFQVCKFLLWLYYNFYIENWFCKLFYSKADKSDYSQHQNTPYHCCALQPLLPKAALTCFCSHLFKAMFSFSTLVAAGRLEIAKPSVLLRGTTDCAGWIQVGSCSCLPACMAPASLRARDHQSASYPFDLCRLIHALL